jgi:hypothetical protein
MGGRKASRTDRFDDFQRGAHCVARVTEVEVDTIPEHLHYISAVVRSDLVDQLRKTHCHAGSFVVPGLLGEPRIAGEIGERCSLDPPRGALTDPSLLKCGLYVLELMLRGEDVRVPSEEPAQHRLSGVTHSETDLVERGLERLVVTKPTSAELLLDRVVEIVNLELRHAPGAVSQDSHGPQYVSFTDTRTEQHRQRLQDPFVVFSDVLVLAGSR